MVLQDCHTGEHEKDSFDKFLQYKKFSEENQAAWNKQRKPLNHKNLPAFRV